MAKNLHTNTADQPLGHIMPWPQELPANKIDTHHHWVPPQYAKAVADAGGDPSGWPTPTWTQHASEKFMGQVGVDLAILSITAPGACILEGEESHRLARSLNDQAATIRDGNPTKFGFFATLSSVLDTDASLKEIAYALDELHADGVGLFTRYGDGNCYLGHPDIEPIWNELNKRRAVVFVHPTHPVDTNKVSAKMPQPLIDYPHETTRAAVDMLLSGTRRKYPDVKVILSHAGGSLPYIIGRIAEPFSISVTTPRKFTIDVTYEQIMKDFRSFYYDVALSTSPSVLRLLFESVPHEQILYGSDFPYAPPSAYPAFLRRLEEYEMTAEVRDKLYFANAIDLFPRLKFYSQRL